MTTTPDAEDAEIAAIKAVERAVASLDAASAARVFAFVLSRKRGADIEAALRKALVGSRPTTDRVLDLADIAASLAELCQCAECTARRANAAKAN